jgi:hypothetical protein
MKPFLALCASFLLLTRPGHAQPVATAVDAALVHRAASNASSLFLDAPGRIHALDTFQKLIRIKGVTGEEQAIHTEVKRLLTTAGAVEIPAPKPDADAPFNLVLEIPATKEFAGQPGILLNAHLDTIPVSAPDRMAFDPATADFFHPDEQVPGKPSSIGGDDRSGVAVMVEAVRTLHTDYWSRGVSHRRLVLVFTAKEERGCIGAKYLAQHRPEVFTNLVVSLAMDGPLDLRSGYPEKALTTVVSNADATKAPYDRVLSLLQDFSTRTKLGLGQTEYGLGFGDFAFFPPAAKAGLHLRSPVRGWHAKERVKVQDQINHVDMVCFLVLAWDHALPAKLSADTVKAVIKAGK